MKNNILDVEVSCFRNYQSPDSPKTITLDKWVNSIKYKDQVLRVRSTESKEERNRLKGQLPAITPSGVYSYRSSENLIQHSGFIQVDIDFSDNKHITNYQTLKQELIKIENFAYLGLSVSGNGYWGLVPILHPEKHSAHFDALAAGFKELGIKIDGSCRDVCRLRGYSVDENAYINYNAKLFCELKERDTNPRRSYGNINNSTESFNYCIQEIQRKGLDISSGDYKTWYEIGCSIASEFGEGGEQFFVIISNQYNDSQSISPERQYRHCLKAKGRYGIGTFYHYCKVNDILYKP